VTTDPYAGPVPEEEVRSEQLTTVLGAEQLVYLHRPEDALARLAPVLASDPDDPLAHAVACRAQLTLGRPDLAEPHARAAATLYDDPLGPYLLTLVHLARNAPGDAVQAAREAIRRAPDRSLGYQAMVYVSLDNHTAVARGRSAARAALERAPSDPDVLVLAAQAWMYNGRRWVRPWDRRTARRQLEAALALAPDHVRARHELATLDALSGRPVSSIRRLGGVLRTDPLHRASHERLNLVMVRLTRHCHLVALVLLIVLGVQRDFPGSERSQWVVAALAAAVLVWMARGLRVGLGAAMLPTLRSWVGGEQLAALWAGLVVVALVAVIVAALVPEAGQAAVATAWFALLGGMALSWMRRRS
jgi:hypothetical protein